MNIKIGAGAKIHTAVSNHDKKAGPLCAPAATRVARKIPGYSITTLPVTCTKCTEIAGH